MDEFIDNNPNLESINYTEADTVESRISKLPNSKKPCNSKKFW